MSGVGYTYFMLYTLLYSISLNNTLRIYSLTEPTNIHATHSGGGGEGIVSVILVIPSYVSGYSLHPQHVGALH